MSIGHSLVHVEQNFLFLLFMSLAEAKSARSLFGLATQLVVTLLEHPSSKVLRQWMRDEVENPVTMLVSSKKFKDFKASWSAASASEGFDEELSSELANLSSVSAL